jgi:ubiquinone/menaquinone biosynthesis C-methylase UbiE
MGNGLFNKIAPVYGMFFNYQVKNYRTVLDKASSNIYIPKHSSFLDIGCGTGALGYALNERGYIVTGVDAAPGMIRQAKELNARNNITFTVGNVLNGLAYNSKSFDIAISSYVAHGMNNMGRKKLYYEASRLAKTMIVFHDYNKKRSLVSDMAEWLEGGDYFNFIKIVESELKEYFGNVQIINVSKSSAWYVVVL